MIRKWIDALRRFWRSLDSVPATAAEMYYLDAVANA